MALGGLSPFPLPLGGGRTDGFTAEQHARVAADLQAVVKTARYAVARINTITPTLLFHISQAGSLPTLVKNGVGDVTITWPVSAKDDYENAWPVNIQHAKATVTNSSTADMFVSVEIASPNQVRVRFRKHDGSVFDSAATVSIW